MTKSRKKVQNGINIHHISKPTKEDLEKAYKTALELSDEIGELLNQRLTTEHPLTISFVFGHLLATWIAAHVAPGDPVKTRQYREMLLKWVVDAVTKAAIKNDGGGSQ